MTEEVTIKLDIRNYFGYLKVLGTSFFQLTDSERLCLAKFMELKYDYKEEFAFSLTNKKKVAKSMNFTNLNTINVYIKKLKDKKAILETDYGYDLNPRLKPISKLSFEFNWIK